MIGGVINLYLKYDNNSDKDKFNPSVYGYFLREFDFQPKNAILIIKDNRNKIIEKKI